MGEQQVVQQEVLGSGRGLGVEHVLTKGPRADGACSHLQMLRSSSMGEVLVVAAR